MDQSVHQQILETASTSSEDKKYHHYLKKTLQVLLPFSLFSFFLSYYYTSVFSHVICFNFHFSTMAFNILVPTLERKYMFLICNGILALLARSSYSSHTSPDTASDLNDDHFNKTEAMETKQMLQADQLEDNDEFSKEPLEDIVLTEDEQEQAATASAAEDKVESVNTEVEETENGVLITEDKVEFLNTEVQETENGVLITEESEEDDEEDDECIIGAEDGNEVNLSTEEFNKKIEEFIRKMKEELRIEAQQQLIAAVQ